MREAVRHIVGVQFRNCATVGGSVYGRFGFSDVLTLLLALVSDERAELSGFLLQALQRGNAAAIHPRRQYRAGKYRLFVQKHGAQPAVGGFAPALDAFAA